VLSLDVRQLFWRLRNLGQKRGEKAKLSDAPLARVRRGVQLRVEKKCDLLKRLGG